jgi:hypothetical protein
MRRVRYSEVQPPPRGLPQPPPEAEWTLWNLLPENARVTAPELRAAVVSIISSVAANMVTAFVFFFALSTYKRQGHLTPHRILAETLPFLVVFGFGAAALTPVSAVSFWLRTKAEDRVGHPAGRPTRWIFWSEFLIAMFLFLMLIYGCLWCIGTMLGYAYSFTK